MLTQDELVAGNDVFVAATGVTSGALLRGVRISAVGVETESLVMRSRSGTVRRIAAYHPSEKVMRLRKESADGGA
jgi:fructose-1,6-bisphosphatase II